MESLCWQLVAQHELCGWKKASCMPGHVSDSCKNHQSFGCVLRWALHCNGRLHFACAKANAQVRSIFSDNFYAVQYCVAGSMAGFFVAKKVFDERIT